MENLLKTKLLLFTVGVLFYTNSIAQNYSEFKSSIIRIKPNFTAKFKLSDYEKDEEYILLPMSFNSATFTQHFKYNYFADKTIEEIYLVYTAYKLAEQFSQPKLNEARLDSLKKIIPNVQKQSWVNWKIIAQTNAKNDKEARKLYHGFIVKIRKQKSTIDEISEMKLMLSNDSLGTESCDSVKKAKLKSRMVRTGRYVPTNIEKLKRGIVYKTKGIGNSRRPEMKPKIDTTWTTVINCGFKKAEIAELYLQNLPDKSVYTILDRNKEWKDLALVCDVTGSMYIYTVQLTIWSRVNKLGNIKHVTYFNDGDNKPDRQKKIGQTGGIYSMVPKSPKQMDSLMTQTMIKGNGGDAEENDLESILKSISSYPESKNIILVADNNSPIKDFSLINKVNKPIRVILCGTEFGVNTQYLDLARLTKGSVHTAFNDYYDLHLLFDLEDIIIDGRKYRLSQGKFFRIFE